MLKEKITSRKNTLVQEAVQIANSPEKRRETGCFFCEGARLCEDAAKSGAEIVRVFLTERACKKYAHYTETLVEAGTECYCIEEHVASLLARTKNTQGVFCICKMKQVEETSFAGKSIVLENMQDPSNLGAVLRTAEALGVDHVILAGEGCDLYSPKVLRASMGAVFRIPVYERADVAELIDNLHKNGAETYAAVPARDAQQAGRVSFGRHAAVFIGNEGNGLTEEAVSRCRHKLTIPMKGRAESLNAAAAASILIWEMMR